jgi:hypothetical protein
VHLFITDSYTGLLNFLINRHMNSFTIRVINAGKNTILEKIKLVNM